jgi:hypothetical protein
MLSSVVPIMGNISQANYAAGNSWMDALAHYRRGQGLATVSINIGLVADSGLTPDGGDMSQYLDRFSHILSVCTNFDELDIGLVASLRGTTADGTPVPRRWCLA